MAAKVSRRAVVAILATLKRTASMALTLAPSQLTWKGSAHTGESQAERHQKNRPVPDAAIRSTQVAPQPANLNDKALATMFNSATHRTGQDGTCRAPRNPALTVSSQGSAPTCERPVT